MQQSGLLRIRNNATAESQLEFGGRKLFRLASWFDPVIFSMLPDYGLSAQCAVTLVSVMPRVFAYVQRGNNLGTIWEQ